MRSGTTAESFVAHLCDRHEQVSQDGLIILKRLKGVNATRTEVLVLSVYNEGIAIAIQRVAALARCLIDRRWLAQDIQYLTSAETC